MQKIKQQNCSKMQLCEALRKIFGIILHSVINVLNLYNTSVE